MNREPDFAKYAGIYRDALLGDVIPFWTQHSPDRAHGGYYTCLDRDGSVYGTDKAMWLQARHVWLFSRLYNAVERRDEWLELARLGHRFLVRHGFDTDGRMFFLATEDGRPLRKRRYLFTEVFGAMAFSEFAEAAGDAESLEHARSLFGLIMDYLSTPGKLPPKVIPTTSETRTHAIPMMLLCLCQQMRDRDDGPRYEEVAGRVLVELFNDFVKLEDKALVETVGRYGDRLDSPAGRCLCPGHAIESAWFLMEEGRRRDDKGIIHGACQVLDWSLERGWDEEHGGIAYFVDAEGKPPEQLEHDMKLWWPHTEALYATLLAYRLTCEKRYRDWFVRLHDWSFEHFADPQFGEWFGYLHYDGTVSLRLKGGTWKGAFHLARSLLNSWRLLEELSELPE
ncbi:MAG: AGE family epimerase/isomerase [Candidatus Brocadiae bacterium]|nr:AGE family epimerase/isomerase [Candidatus Brocadiia bacterium]